MGYIEAGVAKIKGKACVNVNTAEESPILVEAVFRGLLAPLNPMEIAGLLTAFIFQERRVEADFEGLPKNLLKAVEKLKGVAKEVRDIYRMLTNDSFRSKLVSKTALNIIVAFAGRERAPSRGSPDRPRHVRHRQLEVGYGPRRLPLVPRPSLQLHHRHDRSARGINRQVPEQARRMPEGGSARRQGGRGRGAVGEVWRGRLSHQEGRVLLALAVFDVRGT